MIQYELVDPSSQIYYMGQVGPWQIVIVVAIILLFFGGKKIPELMKGLGQGVKSFKDGMKDDDSTKPGDSSEK
jgi:sec-independent protein translocase protein TatA